MFNLGKRQRFLHTIRKIAPNVCSYTFNIRKFNLRPLINVTEGAIYPKELQLH